MAVFTKGTTAFAGLALVALAATACGNSSGSGAAGGGSAPVKVGMIYEKTGIYSVYEQEYRQGFTIGLDYATQGTGKAGSHKVDVTWEDDADSATTAVTDFKSLVGSGYKIIGGTGDSGIATQLAPLAAQNRVLYISGAAAADQITGANKYTFRSGRQTYQDVMTAKSYVQSAGRGQKIVVLAQDYAFGESYVTDAQKVFAAIGDTVTPVLVPLTTTDFTPTALQVKALHPNLIFLAWAGTTGAALAQALDQQGDFAGTKVVTGLGNIATYPFYGSAGTKFDYLSLYFYQASANAANKYLISQMKARYDSVPDLFSSDGFVTAEMVVHAIEAGGGTNVNAMIQALDGWTFLGPKGTEQIRASDHAMLQPMYQVKLVEDSATDFAPTLLKTLSASQTAPPVTANLGS
jgi:branched-chain amino acid transport system substrate-binding protein